LHIHNNAQDEQSRVVYKTDNNQIIILQQGRKVEREILLMNLVMKQFSKLGSNNIG
jgi:hypothetical protein